MHHRRFRLLPLILLAASLLRAAEPKTSVVFYDATPLFKLDLKDEAQRRRFWDESHLIAALQGLANRQGPSLFVRYLSAPDDFWWTQMTSTNGWLAGRPIERIDSLDALVQRFRAVFQGTAVWDERVPATSNLASTVAGCDDLLPLRYDPAEGSLFKHFTEGAARLNVKVRLLQPDGAPMFTGRGVIPGTTLPSTGSAKCDAYVWVIEHYVKPGRADARRLGYYLDAWWLRGWRAAGPENHTLSNHDFVIARRGVLFDLGVWDDESPIDDPGQPPGTDAATLKRLLRAAWDRTEGRDMIHAAGFVPWAYKYTSFKSGQITAGGHHAEVPTEWRYAEILSCFNAFMDADALGLGAMANASFFQHAPLKARYAQPPRPTRQNLIARGVLDASGRIPRRAFVGHYVGDYDAAAWLYRELPRMWNDPARGQVPLSWAFNPNLAERFPLGMAWARERATSNDWFVAGDSGAGYLNPGYLTTPRPHSGLPSGLATWERHCRAFYDRWDLSLTGFVIDGYARGLSEEGWAAYARFSPDGIVAQKVPAQGVRGGMPFLRMATDLPEDAAAAARSIRSLAAAAKPRFIACRSILKSPSWYASVSRHLRETAGDEVQVVDLHTLLWLVREYEAHRADYVDRTFADAVDVSATPSAALGLHPVGVDDGPVDVEEIGGVKCWKAGGGGKTRYLYFDADGEFIRSAQGSLVIEMEYADSGAGRVMLEYDSLDPKAPVDGAYKSHAQVVNREPGAGWAVASWRVTGARCAGSQNGGADFRFVVIGDALKVKRVRVKR